MMGSYKEIYVDTPCEDILLCSRCRLVENIIITNKKKTLKIIVSIMFKQVINNNYFDYI